MRHKPVLIGFVLPALLLAAIASMHLWMENRRDPAYIAQEPRPADHLAPADAPIAAPKRLPEPAPSRV